MTESNSTETTGTDETRYECLVAIDPGVYRDRKTKRCGVAALDKGGNLILARNMEIGALIAWLKLWRSTMSPTVCLHVLIEAETVMGHYTKFAGGRAGNAYATGIVHGSCLAMGIPCELVRALSGDQRDALAPAIWRAENGWPEHELPPQDTMVAACLARRWLAQRRLQTEVARA